MQQERSKADIRRRKKLMVETYRCCLENPLYTWRSIALAGAVKVVVDEEGSGVALRRSVVTSDNIALILEWRHWRRAETPSQRSCLQR